MEQKLKTIAVVTLLTLCGALNAEVLKLKDGKTIEGTLKRTSTGYDVTDAAGVVTHVDSDEVDGITLSAHPTSELEIQSRLQSLRRSAENSSDLNAIIDQYNHFIEQNKDYAGVSNAEKDRADWMDRRAKGLVKVGAKWVTIQERDALRSQVAGLIDQARLAFDEGKTKDGAALVQQALGIDPLSAGGSFLKGLLLFSSDQLTPARKSFDTVLDSVKDHAPSLNNVAVILWKQNQQMTALNFYVQAMTTAPETRQIVDNVAEALNMLPLAMRQNPLAQKAAKLFAAQDAELQQQMMELGWYRWGATWVTKAQFDKLSAIEKEIKAQLDTLSGAYEDLKQKVDQIDSTTDDNTKRMRQIEQTNYATDPKGNLIRLPLPQTYYDLQKQNQQLAQDRAQDVSKLQEMRATAEKIQQRLSTPKYTRIQKMMGPDFAPGLSVKPAAGNVPTTADAGMKKDIAPTTQPVPESTPPLPNGIRKATSKPADSVQPRVKVPDSLFSPE